MRKLLILLVMALMLSVIPASAQDESENAFIELLSKIPFSEAAREWFTYIDYQALTSARPGVPEISSFAEFEELMDADTEESELFMSALMSIQSGPSFFATSFMQGAETPAAVGFDLFQIARAAEYGNPPGNVTILEGDFDASAVIAAHESRDYTQTESGSLTLLCPADGCDSGAMQNLRERNVANPFGGNLGRSQPVLASDQWIVSSTSDTALVQVSEAVSAGLDTLADQPDYRAAAEAMSASGTVIQAYFINPAQLGGSDPAAIVGSRMTQEEIEAIRERLMENFVPMPPYTLIGLSHAVSGDQEYTIVALVYKDEASAEAAAAMFPERLENYTSLVTQQSFADILADRGVTTIEPSVYEASTGRFVMSLTFSNPLPGTEIPEGSPGMRSLGMVYAAFTRAYVSRDLGWLATAF